MSYSLCLCGSLSFMVGNEEKGRDLKEKGLPNVKGKRRGID
jgi:hypothetical protein